MTKFHSATFFPVRGRQVAIEARDVHHAFGTGDTRTSALVDVDLEIGRGEVVILTGPSGSGKTTLLTLIGTLRGLQQGTLRVLGQDLGGLTRDGEVALRKKTGFVFQTHNLFSSLSAIENVRMATGLQEGRVRERNARARGMLERLGLGDRLHNLPAKLSGGQRQRVAIARALVNEPELVLADEPTASLDAASGQEVLALLHEMADGPRRTTVLIVTHDQRVLERADRVVNLVGGRIVSNVRPEVTLRIVQMLRALPDLAGMKVESLTKCADEMMVESYAAGDQIVREGARGDRWYLIGEGQVEWMARGQAARVLGPGDQFGVFSHLNGETEPATVRARTEVELYAMTEVALERVMGTEPGIEDLVKRELMSRQ